MKKFSDELREEVVHRIESKKRTVKEEALLNGVSTATIYRWIKQSNKAVMLNASETQEDTQMDSIRLPKGFTYLDAYEAVVLKRNMSTTEFGAYCRKTGLTTLQVDEWVEWFSKHKDAVDSSSFKKVNKQLAQERKLRIRENKENAQKLADAEKARARAEGMYALSKKAEAIFKKKDV